MKLESVSLVATPFLDFWIRKDSSGCLEFFPFVKDTARHLPLTSDSIHPWPVHRSWPLAECRRLAKRGSAVETAKAWIEAKIARRRYLLMSEVVCQRCEKQLRECIKSEVAESFTRGSVIVEPSGILRVRSVLPFRPEVRGLPRAIHGFLAARSGHLADTLGIRLDVQISWCRASAPLAQLLK